ncbi:MAG: hypothetical protein MZV64_60730 [Ignavibacteriales bacterium]|nr:hypothetical protein [Ignavibacteriales bacterium]
MGQQTDIHGEILTRRLLELGFVFEDERIPLVSPAGTFKPRWMEYPLSITSTTESPYDDKPTDDGYPIYKYRGNDPSHRDNVGLRECMNRGIPLIYLLGLVPGKYLPVWPVYIIGDEPSNLSFTVTADELSSLMKQEGRVQEPDEKRLYLTTLVKIRLHQQAFRRESFICI